ncbi:MAG: hypothetical protein AAF805_00195 [Planctomycetota bacterium]
MSTSQASGDKPKRPTGHLIRERAALQETVDEASRAAGPARKQIAQIDKEIAAYAETRPGREFTFAGWRFSFERKPRAVKWADEFVRHVGAEVAKRLKGEAGTVEKLVAEKVGK